MRRHRCAGRVVAGAVAALVGLAGLTACESAESVPDAPAPSGAGAFEGPLPGAAPTSDTAFTGVRHRTHAPASAAAKLSPTGMRFGVHRRWDRVVVHLSGPGHPGWRARYVDRPGLAGTATLALDVRGVVPPTAEHAEAWSGADVLRPQTGNLVEEVRRGPLHHGVQRILVGVDTKRPFRVFALEDPARVVLDVRRPRPPHFRGPLNGVPPLKQAGFHRIRGVDTSTGTADARLSPTDLRLGYHHTFERLVLGLRGPGRPGWDVQYVDHPALPGSRAGFALAGHTVLRVRVTGVVPPTAKGAHRYRGPQRFVAYRKGPVREVVYGTVRDGAVEVYVGTSDRRPFRVFEVGHPKRVVIDLQR